MSTNHKAISTYTLLGSGEDWSVCQMEEDECEHMPQENPREELSQDPVPELSGGPAGGGSRYPPSHHLILPRAPRCASGDTAGPVHR
ncbi:GTPase IMAP family member 6 isoform X4 [Macaca mulatta]